MAKANRIGDLNIRLGLDTSKFVKQLNKAQRRMGRMSREFSSIGNQLTRSITLPLGAVAAKAVMTTAEFEKLEQSLKVLSGSAEAGAEAFERLQRFSASTPFQLQDLVGVNNALLGFGMSVDEAYDSLQFLGDAAAITGGDLNRIAIAFGQSAASGRVMASDLNQFVNNSIPIFKLLGETTGKTAGELRKMAEKGELSFDLLSEAMQNASKEGGLFYKGMELQSKTLSGLFSTLKDNVNLALGEIGEEIVDTFDIKDVTKSLTDSLASITQKFKDMSPAQQESIVKMSAFAAAAPLAVTALGSLTRNASTLIHVLKILARNPLVAVASAIGVVVMKLRSFETQADRDADMIKNLDDRLNTLTSRGVANATKGIEALRVELKVAEASGGDLEKIQKKLMERYPEHAAMVEKVGGTYEGLSTAINTVSESIRELASAKALSSMVEELSGAIVDIQKETVQFELDFGIKVEDVKVLRQIADEYGFILNTAGGLEKANEKLLEITGRQLNEEGKRQQLWNKASNNILATADKLEAKQNVAIDQQKKMLELSKEANSAMVKSLITDLDNALDAIDRGVGEFADMDKLEIANKKLREMQSTLRDLKAVGAEESIIKGVEDMIKGQEKLTVKVDLQTSGSEEAEEIVDILGDLSKELVDIQAIGAIMDKSELTTAQDMFAAIEGALERSIELNGANAEETKKLAQAYNIQKKSVESLVAAKSREEEQIKKQEELEENALGYREKQIEKAKELEGVTEKYSQQVEALNSKLKLGVITNEEYADGMLALAEGALNELLLKFPEATGEIEKYANAVRAAKSDQEQFNSAGQQLAEGVQGALADLDINNMFTDLFGVIDQLAEDMEGKMSQGLKDGMMAGVAAAAIAFEAINAMAQSRYESEKQRIADYEARERQRINNSLVSEDERARLIARLEDRTERKKAELQRKQAERSKRLAMLQAILNTAVAVTAQLAVGNIAGAAIAGIAGGVQIATIGATTPALANGGVAFGETQAIVGDNVNARVNPEVIAPLDKLQKIMGSGSQNVHVTGSLIASGDDLIAVLEKNNNNSFDKFGDTKL